MPLKAQVAACRRTLLAAAATVVAVATATALAPPSGASAPASPSAPAAPAAPAAPTAPAAAPFSPGTANAVAVVNSIAPGVGALELAIDQGIAVSEVTNTLAQAQSQTVDFGLIGGALTGGSCGSDGVPPEYIPQPLTVDNRDGDVRKAHDDYGAGPAGGFGRLEAMATTVPSSGATSTLSGGGIPGLIEVGNGRANAVTEVIPDEGREARASVDVSVDLGGAVQLHGMQWKALHRTGTDPAAEGSFEVTDATAGGVPIEADSTAELEDAVNEALTETGITVELPRVEHQKEPTDLVRVTPLRIAIDNSPLARTVFGPALDATREGRIELFNQLSEAICQAPGVLFVGDVALSIVAGTGFLALELGGAEATSDELIFTDPFGELPLEPPPPPVPVTEPPPPPAAPTTAAPPVTVATTPEAPATPAPAAPAAAPEVAAPAPSPSPAAATPPAATPTAAKPTQAATPPQARVDGKPTAAAGPLERLCESLHPFAWPSCSDGAAVPLGLAGIGATAAMAALDWRHQKRRAALVGSAA